MNIRILFYIFKVNSSVMEKWCNIYIKSISISILRSSPKKIHIVILPKSNIYFLTVYIVYIYMKQISWILDCLGIKSWISKLSAFNGAPRILAICTYLERRILKRGGNRIYEFDPGLVIWKKRYSKKIFFFHESCWKWCTYGFYIRIYKFILYVIY